MKRIATTLLVAGLLATPLLALPPPATAGVSIGISIGIAPPALPVYEQPMAPGPGYIWTPGYWAWNPAYNDYYWVPGTWVMPPMVGLLWTPGWWGWSGGYYRWHAGYWGRHVGFYGGVNYGFGYFGTGYSGGYWRGRDFYYNRAVNNINVTHIRNVYIDKTVINNIHVSRVSYNGGRGGITAQPSAVQREYANQRRYQPTTFQTRQHDTAMRNPGQRFNGSDHGRPAVYATQRGGAFEGSHVVQQPVSPHARMVTAPRAATSQVSPSGRNGFVEAPRNSEPAMRAPARPYRESEGTHVRPATPAGNAPPAYNQDRPHYENDAMHARMAGPHGNPDAAPKSGRGGVEASGPRGNRGNESGERRAHRGGEDRDHGHRD